MSKSKALSVSITVEHEDEPEFNLLKKEKISKMLFFCHKETSLGLLAAAVSMFIISYIMVFLSMYMTKHFKIDKANMGYVFSVMTIPYLLSCAVIPGLIKDCVPRRL